ncbi:MAG: peptidylprolyl isomerase [Fibrobacteria bacterium]
MPAFLLIALSQSMGAEAPAQPHVPAAAADSAKPALKTSAAGPAASSAPAVADTLAANPAKGEAGATPSPLAQDKTKKAKVPSAGKPASKSPAGVVITVGPNKISKRQIDTLVDLMIKVKHTTAEAGSPERLYLERMIATNLIGQELLDLEAKRLNVVADEKTIDSLAAVFRTNFPNDQSFRQALKQAGDSESGLRLKMARQIKADKLLTSQVAPVSRPTPQEMQDFFKANKAAFPVNDSLRACQIVFLLGKNAAPAEAAKRKSDLESIRADLARDSTQLEALLSRFVMKARDLSDGPEKKDGGDLQRFLPGDFNAEFKQQVSRLKVGQMSPVFRSPLGWHLVLLTEKNDGKFESYQLQVARVLMSEKSAQAGKGLKKYLQTLAERYKVSYLSGDYRDSTVAGVY